ncbi:GSCOCG00012175001-RA-CDS [Cotesia congregata]|nr:GSCOCG00012175001-RA-CDS [Cotesia congregata]
MGQNKAIHINADNLDLFLYINAKIIYVERYIRRQVESLYIDVMKYRCKLKKDLLKNTLAIASTQPDETCSNIPGSKSRRFGKRNTTKCTGVVSDVEEHRTNEQSAETITLNKGALAK